MPSLKDLKVRINSVKSTQKITAAMKMVAASKLRRAQEQAEATRPYAERMERMMDSLAVHLAALETSLEGAEDGELTAKMVSGTGSDKVQLLVVVTSDRGLCGGFNGSIVREARRTINRLEADGKTVKLITVGRKGRDLLRREFAGLIVHSYEDVGKRKLTFSDGEEVGNRITAMLEAGEFDVCTVIYNKFKSVITQVVTVQQLVPLPRTEPSQVVTQVGKMLGHGTDDPTAAYEFEPDEQTLLKELLPRNMSFQLYRALLESAASEQGARMSAMDSATRNAGDMINKLTLNYNRTRQAVITKELIEIISGAEAV